MAVLSFRSDYTPAVKNAIRRTDTLRDRQAADAQAKLAPSGRQ